MNTKLELTSLPERVRLIESVIAVDSVDVLCGEEMKKEDASGETAKEGEVNGRELTSAS